MTLVDTALPIDPEVLAVLRSVPGSMSSAGLTEDGILQMRSAQEPGRLSDHELAARGEVEVWDVELPGPSDNPVLRALVLRPTSGPGPWPLIYSIHGGGLIMGDNRTDIRPMVEWVRDVGVVVVSVEYRLAPEHRAPAAAEDCYAGLLWAAEQAAFLNVDLDDVIVAGASAGGGIAAALALMSRDRHGPAISHQMLMCPMLDDRCTTRSSFLSGVPWDRTSNLTAWNAALGNKRGSADVSQYCAPARAADLSGLPPAYLDVGAVEVFRDEAINYATRLGEAGVPIELHVWAGATHGFDQVVPQASVSQAAKLAQTVYLRRAVGR